MREPPGLSSIAELALPSPPPIEDHIRALLDASSDAVLMVADDGRVLDCNATAAKMFGHPRERMLALRYEDLCQHGLETEIRRIPGGTHEGIAWSWVSIRDLSDRRRAEQALAQMRDANELWRALSDAAFEAVIMHRDGIIHMGNRAADIYSGVEPGGMRGRRLMDFIAPQSRAMVMAKVAAGDDTPYESYGQRLDGSIYPVEVHPRTIPVELESGTVRVVVLRDMTMRRQLEEQLRQAQKMEAIGRLAGGIAHDFNNLLSVMLGATELAAEGLPAEHPSRADLDDVVTAASRAADLTRQLLAFGRKSVMRPQVVDLVAVLEGMRSLLRRLLREDMGLTLTMPDQPALVRVDPVSLEQVLLNLVVNARDAMPEGGEIRITIVHEQVDVQFARTHMGVKPGPHIVLSVADTGVGMDEDTRARVFEPFFTTKGPSGGHGLGLATVFGIVEQSGGTIWVDSELGRGTRFSIYLPVSDTHEVSEPPPPTPATPQRPLTILVVEDEDAVRRVVVELLTRDGHRVLSAADPRGALELARAQRGNIDLLLTDVVMPELGGLQLAERIIADDPRVRVLFMSGHAEEIIARGELGHDASFNPSSDLRFVAKPIDSASLRDAIGRALAKPDGAGTRP